MAYYTGKDVDVWVSTEHPLEYVSVTDNALLVTTASAGATKISDAIFSGSLGMAGLTANRMTDVTGCDVSIGAQDEDISFFGLRNVGKIEVKKDTSVTITRKKSDNKNMVAFQGTTNASHSQTDGKHGARWGLIEDPDSDGVMVIADGTTDPKSATDDATPALQCYGWRVFIELKADSTGTANDGTVLVRPNCTMMEYSSTVANESANEETFTFTSMVKPIIWNGTKASNRFQALAITQTTAANM